MPRAELPTHFIVYPEWFGIPYLLGYRFTERRVDGATILGGPLMVACAADYSWLNTGAKPTIDLGGRRLLDELDVADLESESAHGYVVGYSTPSDNQAFGGGELVDGGRAHRSREDFWLDVQGDGQLVLRISSDEASSLTVSIAGKPALQLTTSVGPMQELSFPVPSGIARGRVAVALRSQPPLA
jgi:hypothetical protein